LSLDSVSGTGAGICKKKKQVSLWLLGLARVVIACHYTDISALWLLGLARVVIACHYTDISTLWLLGLARVVIACHYTDISTCILHVSNSVH